MARLMGSGEFDITMKIRMSRVMADSIRDEARNQHIPAASIIRGCIDAQLDPKRRLELLLEGRSTPLERLIGQVYPLLDAGQMDEYDMLVAEGAAKDDNDEENLVSWLLARQKELDIPLQ